MFLKRNGDTVADLVVALTAVNPYPHTVKGMDAYIGNPLDDATFGAVRTRVKPMQTTVVAPPPCGWSAGAKAGRKVGRGARVGDMEVP